MTHPADTASDFYGQKMLRLGAGLVDGHEFLALPEHCQEDLLALYGAAMLRVSGGLA